MVGSPLCELFCCLNAYLCKCVVRFSGRIPLSYDTRNRLMRRRQQMKRMTTHIIYDSHPDFAIGSLTFARVQLPVEPQVANLKNEPAVEAETDNRNSEAETVIKEAPEEEEAETEMAEEPTAVPTPDCTRNGCSRTRTH